MIDMTSFSIAKDVSPSSRHLSLNAKRTISLASVKGFGVKTFNKLHSILGSVETLWQASYEDLVALELNAAMSRAICDARETFESRGDSPTTKRIQDWLADETRHFISIDDSSYPAILREIHCSPPYLYVEGCLESLSASSIAVVGSRNASISGIQQAHLFSKELAANRLAVVSGLALGIDAAAHKGALEADGMTLGVLATGLDLVYPKKHQYLAEQIKERGALISEMSLGTMPIPANFPRRNRVISGLCMGVLVVEASVKSGSLITADYAIEQNRDVFAIPGSTTNPLAKGCHHLIKQGAHLVEDASDILDSLSFSTTQQNRGINDMPNDLSDAEMKLLSSLGHDQLGFDDLIVRTGLSADVLMEQLMWLELKGLLATVPGGYQRI